MSVDQEVQLDLERQARIGIAEAILCRHKTPAQIEEILRQVMVNDRGALLTRLSKEAYAALPASITSGVDYDPGSQTAFFNHSPGTLQPARVAVVAAGTSDARVAREATRTLEYHGHASTAIFDVGVAGLWRLLERGKEIAQHPVVIVVAGMDGALPSVLGGLVPSVVIAVPTTTGYGMARGGETALAACLTSCAPGVTVCNIANGYGAACAALRVLEAVRNMEQNEAA